MSILVSFIAISSAITATLSGDIFSVRTLKSLVTFFCSIFLHLLNWICLFRATGGAAWDGEKKANSLSACGSQRDKEKSLRCGRVKRRINAK